MSAPTLLFEDTFEVTAIDSSRFDKVSRISMQALTFLSCKADIDINTHIYKVQNKDTFSIGLATTPEDNIYEVNSKNNSSLIDQYEYVMFGKVYKVIDIDGNLIEIYISFGGLLMKITGDTTDFEGIHLDNRIYLLMKRV
jgi:DNA-directed RNA polymerases I, II, and III subunit RPABC3